MDLSWVDRELEQRINSVNYDIGQFTSGGHDVPHSDAIETGLGDAVSTAPYNNDSSSSPSAGNQTLLSIHPSIDMLTQIDETALFNADQIEAREKPSSSDHMHAFERNMSALADESLNRQIDALLNQTVQLPSFIDHFSVKTDNKNDNVETPHLLKTARANLESTAKRTIPLPESVIGNTRIPVPESSSPPRTSTSSKMQENVITLANYQDFIEHSDLPISTIPTSVNTEHKVNNFDTCDDDTCVFERSLQKTLSALSESPEHRPLLIEATILDAIPSMTDISIKCGEKESFFDHQHHDANEIHELNQRSLQQKEMIGSQNFEIHSKEMAKDLSVRKESADDAAIEKLRLQNTIISLESRISVLERRIEYANFVSKMAEEERDRALKRVKCLESELDAERQQSRKISEKMVFPTQRNGTRDNNEYLLRNSDTARRNDDASRVGKRTAGEENDNISEHHNIKQNETEISDLQRSGNGKIQINCMSDPRAESTTSYKFTSASKLNERENLLKEKLKAKLLAHSLQTLLKDDNCGRNQPRKDITKREHKSILNDINTPNYQSVLVQTDLPFIPGGPNKQSFSLPANIQKVRALLKTNPITYARSKSRPQSEVYSASYPNATITQHDIQLALKHLESEYDEINKQYDRTLQRYKQTPQGKSRYKERETLAESLREFIRIMERKMADITALRHELAFKCNSNSNIDAIRATSPSRANAGFAALKNAQRVQEQLALEENRIYARSYGGHL